MLYSVSIDGKEPGGIFWFHTKWFAQRRFKNLRLSPGEVAILAKHSRKGITVLEERS